VRIITIIFSFITIICAQTNISGAIEKNTKWEKTGSPFIITGNTVINNAELTISPGVDVQLTLGVFLKVQEGGSIKAIGEENDMITFSPKDGVKTDRIIFDEGALGTTFNDDSTYLSGSLFEFCIFKDFIADVFNDSINGGKGGAIYTQETALMFNHCQFLNNSAKYGGAIAITENNLAIKNSIFKNNSAEFGGAIFCEEKNGNSNYSSKNPIAWILIDSTDATENKSSRSGGFYFSGWTNVNRSTITIKNSNFSKNNAVEDGGVFFIGEHFIEKFIVINSKFIENTSEKKGGVFLRGGGNYYPDFLIKKSLFKANKASNGGVFYLSADPNMADKNIENEVDLSSFILNESKQNSIGAFIFSNKYGGSDKFNSIVFSNSIFDRNNTLADSSIADSLTSNSLESNFPIIINNNFFSTNSGKDILIRANTAGKNNVFYNNIVKILIKYEEGLSDIYDIKDNYWGTTIKDSISKLIFDWYDDPNYNTSKGEFEPYLLRLPKHVNGSPTLVHDIQIMKDDSYIEKLSMPIKLDNLNKVYIKVSAKDEHPLVVGITGLTIINQTNSDTLDLILTELVESQGTYVGYFYLNESLKNNSLNYSDGDIIEITSIVDEELTLYINKNNPPKRFEWVSSALDTINITQTNLTDNYTLQWGASTDEADGDTINYLLYAGTGAYPKEEVYDTTSTSVLIPYQEFLENVFEQIPMLSRATVRFTVYAHDGTDSVKVTGDDRVVYVNRYEYLSTVGEGIPTEFALHENYPNPFNPSTTLRFDLPELSDVNVVIYNMLGQKVKTFNMHSTPAGYHSIKWNATNDLGDPVSAGVYLYQLQAKNFVKTRKMILLK